MKYKIIKRNKIKIFKLIKSIREGLGKQTQGKIIYGGLA
jgi:hypothetical protein